MAAIVVVLPLLFPSAYYYRVAALVFVFALASIGLNLLMGFAGQVSLGHAGFMGIGAYAVAIGPTHLGVASWLSFVIGAALSALVAFVVGRPILRLKGHYLAVATLGFGLLLAIVFTNEARFTGGPDGMAVPRLVLFGSSVWGAQSWYWIIAASFLVGAVLALNLIESPTGRALRAIHDSEVAARVLGLKAKDVLRALSTRDTHFVYVARKATPKLATLLARKKLAGFHFYGEERRTYPQGAVAAQVLGYAGVDNTGLSGLELQLNSQLTGAPGVSAVVKAVAGIAPERTVILMVERAGIVPTLARALDLRRA